MALNQTTRSGVNYVEGTTADIEADRAASKVVRGRLYWRTDGDTKQGRGVSATVIDWEIKQADVVAAVAVETARATAAESVLDQKINKEVGDRMLAIAQEADFRVLRDQQLEVLINAEAATRLANDDTETAARIAGDAANASALAAEITRNTTALDAEIVLRASEDARIETAFTTAITSAVAALRDTTVSDIIPVTYTNGQTLSLQALLGAGRPDGIYSLPFTAGSIDATAQVDNGHASGSVSYELFDIDFGDELRVKIDGGNIVTVSLIDNLNRQKFASLDTSIANLEAATTVTAIRGHFSDGELISITNGVIAFKLSTDPNNDLRKSSVDGGLTIVVGTTNVNFTNELSVATTATVNDTFTDIYGKLATGTTDGESGIKKVGSKLRLGGTPLLEDAVFTGDFAMDMGAVSVVKVPYIKAKCYSKVNDSRAAATGAEVELWFDQDGDPQFTFIPN